MDNENARRRAPAALHAPGHLIDRRVHPLWTSRHNDRSAPYGHLTLQRTAGGDAEDAANPYGVCGLADGVSRLGVPLGGDANLPL